MSAVTAIAQPQTDERSQIFTPIARAESLRSIAAHVHPVLAQAYQRRAAELTFGAWVHALRVAPVEIDEFTD
ncbi:MAG TPA: hypothetical protein VFZ83_15245, partial [Acidimicrobiia bacterium]|nr:hypothetical protein [Acidimicrobiia bacterium]